MIIFVIRVMRYLSFLLSLSLHTSVLLFSFWHWISWASHPRFRLDKARISEWEQPFQKTYIIISLLWWELLIICLEPHEGTISIRKLESLSIYLCRKCVLTTITIGILYTAGMASITPNTFFDFAFYKACLFDKHNITFHLRIMNT